jgi:hypothetical protein
VELGFSSKSCNGQQKFSSSLSLEQADKMSSGSPKEVDTFSAKSQLIFFKTGNWIITLKLKRD